MGHTRRIPHVAPPRPFPGRDRPARSARWRQVATLALGVLLASTIAGATASRAAGPQVPEVAVVLPGDTLWSIAARHLPSRDPYRMIYEIRRLNDLPDHVIHPGQELILP